MAAYDALHINWVDVFAAWGKPKKSTGDNYSMSCPIPGHDDKHASFTFNGKNGMWQCRGACLCTGNGHQIFEKVLNLSAGDAFKHVMALGGVIDEPKKKKSRSAREALSLTGYSNMKKIPPEFLMSLAVTDKVHPQWKLHCVAMPYMNPEGVVTAVRYRTEGRPKFGWDEKNVVSLYGLWLDLNKNSESIVFVEGESDCHTLWHHRVPAYGVPGATAFNKDFVKVIPHVKNVYVLVEPPDEKQDAGEHFFRDIASAAWASDVKVYRLSSAAIGYKDPSDMHLQCINFKENWDKVMAGAVLVERNELARKSHDCPVAFNTPNGYTFTKRGIYCYDEDGSAKLVTSTPICIDAILTDDSGLEYVRLCFRHHIKGWIYTTVKRGDVVSGRKILELADRGLDVSESSSKRLANFMCDLLRYNPETPYKTQYQRGGWSNNMREFVPLKMSADACVDTNLFAGYEASGDISTWVAGAVDARKNYFVRAVMAAYASSALLKILNLRSFFFHMFNHQSGVGKTCAQKLACSLYGDPEKVIRTFNSTITGLERAAAQHNDIGLCLDEYQMLNEFEKEKFVNEIYKLIQGVSKARSNVRLESVPVDSWRLCFVTSGEFPLTDKSNLQGIRTRVLEAYGAPFEDQSKADAMYAMLSDNYGHIGPIYIDYVQRFRGQIKERFKVLNEQVREHMKRYRGAVNQHTANLTAIVLADEILSMHLREKPSKLSDFLDAIYGYEAIKVPIIEQVPDAFYDWLAKNSSRIPFITETGTVRDLLGWTGDSHIFLINSAFDAFAKDICLSRTAVLSQLKDCGIIEPGTSRHPKMAGHVVRGHRVKFAKEVN